MPGGRFPLCRTAQKSQRPGTAPPLRHTHRERKEAAEDDGDAEEGQHRLEAEALGPLLGLVVLVIRVARSAGGGAGGAHPLQAMQGLLHPACPARTSPSYCCR